MKKNDKEIDKEIDKEMMRAEAMDRMVWLGASRDAASAALAAVEQLPCTPTNRVLPAGDARREWAATLAVADTDGMTLTMYYMTTPEDEQELDDVDGDWGTVAWDNRVDRYEVR